MRVGSRVGARWHGMDEGGSRRRRQQQRQTMRTAALLAVDGEGKQVLHSRAARVEACHALP